MRIFEESGISVKGNILPIHEFSFFTDLTKKSINKADEERLIAPDGFYLHCKLMARWQRYKHIFYGKHNQIQHYDNNYLHYMI